MPEVAEAEVAQSDALFAAPAKPRAVPFIGPEADGGSSPGHSAPAAAVVARHARDGYGNASTARLVSRMRIQRKAVVSTPGDPFEREAEAVASSVVAGGTTPSISPVTGGVASVARETAYEEPKKKPSEESAEPVQRAGGGDVSPDVSDAADAAISNPGPGTPMHPATRGTLESRLGTDLGDVRIHDDATAQHQAAAVEARAFTHGNDIWLGSGESQSDLSLMAHETTHVVQQRGGSAVQRTPLVQRLIPDFILSGLADYARHIPGWTLFTVILGFNPLTGDAVPRTAINLLEGFFGLVPFGTLIFDTLREHGIIDAAFTWVEGELGRLDLSLNRIERTISAAWDDVRLLEGFDYNLNVLRRHFGALYDDVVRFANSLVDQILRMIKEAVVGVAESLLAENRAWALVKKILGHDPLRDVAVTATPTEILEDFLILIGKQQHLDQMRQRGTVEETANWLATQIATFMTLLGELRGLIGRAWDAIQPANLANLMNDMRALATDAGAFLQRVWDFASTVAIKVLELIKNALLGWLSSFAHELPGFHLVTVIIGRNPFTGEEVPRTAQNIIRGFITLLPGGNEIYAHLEETGIVTSAAARIEGAMESLGISWAFIVGLFSGLWNSLSIEDLLTPIDTFTRIVAQFGEPISRLVQFVGVVLREMIYLILQMMNFPFDLIGSIVTNAMAAIEDIKRDPIGFLQHMLDAIKLGFSNFFDNIVTHLLGGLADWLFRGLRSAGIEPPTDLTFASVLDFVLNVLGISMERIWEKLGNRIGAENVARIRGVIDRLVGIWSFIKDVQERGVVAIWEYIEGQLSNLWNMVLQKAQDFIMERIINRAIQWLLSLLDVTGIMPVINAVMGFFHAVQSAIEYLRDILEIINDWVTTIAAVARGEIQPGADKMERGLANAIPVAIGFLANQFGLGNIGEKIGEIVEGLRALVDQALDWLIDRAVSAMESLMATLGFGGGEEEAEAAAAGAGDIDAPAPLATEGHIVRAHIENGQVSIRMASGVFGGFVEKVLEIGNEWAPIKRNHPAGDLAGELAGLISQASILRTSAEAITSTTEEATFRARSLFLNQGVTALAANLVGILNRFEIPRIEGVAYQTPPPHAPQYQSLGGHRRPQGMSSVLSFNTRPHMRGTNPGVDVAGAGRNIVPRTYQRGHLLAASLGGSNSDVENFAPMSPGTNQNMRIWERPIMDALNADVYPPWIVRFSIDCDYLNDEGSLAGWLGDQVREMRGSDGGSPSVDVDAIYAVIASSSGLTESALAAALGVTEPQLARRSSAIRERLLRSFTPRGFGVDLEVVQGEGTLPQSTTIPNHLA